MELIHCRGNESLAMVYLLRTSEGRMIECVESLQPPFSREDKWVLIVSTHAGCPIQCLFCDAGSHYAGPLSAAQIIEQITFMVNNRFPKGKVHTRKFKVQFARMGEPTLNPAVLDAICQLIRLFPQSSLMPTISTVAPKGSDSFLSQLANLRSTEFKHLDFQLQFSIHSTDERVRDTLIPVKKWSLKKIATYSHAFHLPQFRKVTLNFSLARHIPIEVPLIEQYFSPEHCFIKLTPLNPTYQSRANNLSSAIESPQQVPAVAESFEKAGYEVLFSYGEEEENFIGSNCGQLFTTHLKNRHSPLTNAYT